MGELKLLRITYSWLCQLLHPFDFFVGDYVNVADNVRAVPLILLFDGCQHVLGVAIVVMVTTEQPALSAGGLIERKQKQGTKELKLKCILKVRNFVFVRLLAFLTILLPSPRQSISYFFRSGTS